jgi:hypothetical protein
VNIFKVAPQVATLSEVLAAKTALERSLASMLSKVVSQVARFLENSAAVGILALKEELSSLGIGVPHLDGTMPFTWDSFESLGTSLRFLWATKTMVQLTVIRNIVFFIVRSQ